MAQQVIQVLDREPTPLDRAYLLYELQRLAGEDILGQNGYRLAAERLERVQARHRLQRDQVGNRQLETFRQQAVSVAD